MRKLLVLAIVMLAGVGLYLGVDSLTKPEVEVGEKEITINLVIIDETEEVYFEETVNTDAEMLSSLLEEMDEADYFELHLGGEKTDQYGRFLIGFDDYETEDMNVGPWWGYTSETNKDCVAAGFCSGVDMAPVYDGDTFTFTLDING